MDFTFILFMMLLMKKPCFCNNESVFYNSSQSSSPFLLVYVLCFQSSSSALSSSMIISTLLNNFHTFKSFLQFPSSLCDSGWSSRFFFQIYVPCVQCLLNDFYHSKNSPCNLGQSSSLICFKFCVPCFQSSLNVFCLFIKWVSHAFKIALSSSSVSLATHFVFQGLKKLFPCLLLLCCVAMTPFKVF
jgi:hypothetical protein